MKPTARLLFLLALLPLSGCQPGPDRTPKPDSLLPGTSNAWELVWNDEFNGLNATLDARWKSQNGPSGHILCSRWRENAMVTNGALRLEARKEKRGGQDWTAGNIWTTQQFQYGYFECRYRYAAAEGLNNSFWLMPTDKKTVTRGKFFELDVNEGHYPNKLSNNIHNHTDVIVVNGRRTHPSSSRTFTFGTRPDVKLHLENPVTTQRIRLSSTHGQHFHLGEVRLYAPHADGYPDPLSPTADTDKPGLVNFARDTGTVITVSGCYQPGTNTMMNLVDGNPATRWITQRAGEKWVEFEFPEPRTIGGVQFLNGYQDKGQWKGMIDNYKVAYHNGTGWVGMTSFDIMEGSHNFARDYQVHGFEWTETELIFYLNGKEIRREKNEFCLSPASVWLSLAIIPWGGRITDDIHGTAMEVDWVRVYRRK